MKISNIRLQRAGTSKRFGRNVSAASGWVVAGVLAVALAGGAAVATVGGDAGSERKTDAAVAERAAGKDSKRAAKAVRHWGKRVAHGEAVLGTKDLEHRSVLAQRGEVTAVSSEEMTVRSSDGFTATWAFDDKTRVRSEGKRSGVDDLETGDEVGVAGAGSGDEGTARFVRARN